MSLIRYKVLESEVKDSIAYLPIKAIPLSIWTLSEPGPNSQVILYKVNIAFMMKYEDWAKEFPDDALKEAILRVKTDEEGTEDAQ